MDSTYCEDVEMRSACLLIKVESTVFLIYLVARLKQTVKYLINLLKN